ncbi:MAG: SbcC/MukB-like Walker B domain-containing protein [Eubacteriales bacterium]|nr:SbcC/MukB-like Walker B domain-containing protein [Eubacteriales bacterium]
MIALKKVRLINWYGFSNVTAPIGFFTLIAGRNGNGKSAMLDAVKYAAYGDTVFNKSSESKGSRTLSSYTRGLLDATAGTYMRPADRVPNVYSHIVLEYFDDVEEKSFVLGAVIETNTANNCQTYRYVADRFSLDQMEHTYKEEGLDIPFSASALQKKYRLTLLNREQGLPRFMQMTGLKLNLGQMPTYLQKLRGIMSYDPNAKIDQFIRESVLEERNVDFKKLIEAKANIEQLNDNFNMIQEEISELDCVLGEYDAWENESNRLLADDIRIVYRNMKILKEEIEKQNTERERAQRSREDVAENLKILENRKQDVENRLIEAKTNLRNLDSVRMITQEEERLEKLEKDREALLKKCRDLEQFQTVVSELMNRFFKKTEQIADRDILAALCGYEYTTAQKASAVAEIKQKTGLAYDEIVKQIFSVERGIEELERELDTQNRILEECKRHQNTYRQIPEYVGLKEQINRELERRKISARAQFACEYVIGLEDEKWRNAIEAFLGPRRYTILVDPEYYDIADDVLNGSEYRYAHLFNTKLLMRRDVKVEEDSVVSMLQIKNPVAKRYFEFQLGRMRAVSLEKVRMYENAISKEGRVSVAMDGYFLRFDRIRSYYLGQKTFELNRIRAQKEIVRLQAEKKEKLSTKNELSGQNNTLTQYKEFFWEYDYDAHSKYQRVSGEVRESKAQLERLRKAQANNQEYIELNETVGRLDEEQKAIGEEYAKNVQTDSEQKTVIVRCEDRIKDKTEKLEEQEKQYKEYQIEHYTIVQKTVDAYEKYLENGRKGPGGLLADETRGRVRRSIEQHKSSLMQLQADYNAKHSDNMLPRGTEGRSQYAARRDRIWMDNLQEIRQKLEEQTRRYEDIFKNEFVLTILNSCERARDDLKQINRELANLNFAAKYEFDVHYVRDGSEYAKIIDYARFLDEREQLGGGAEGQMTFGMLTAVSDEEGEQLEQDMKRIVNRIIEKNSEEAISRFADYRNYMTYEILVTNQVLNRAKLSRQTGFNSGAEVQIPYLLILASALLLIYNQRINSTRLVFIDEPFAKMDPGNVKQMLDFLRSQRLQVIFCSPDKTDSIGNECEVILPALRVAADRMELGIVQFHKEKVYGNV